MKNENKKILVGMSGGVDSSVAVLLLQKEGYQVAGIFLDFVGGERSEKDFQSAQAIAKKLNIPIDKVNARNIFKEKIIDKFVDDYKKGVTPNPCVMCNPEMKFKILIDEAERRGIKFISTGHYAKITKIQETRDNQISNFKLKISNEVQNIENDELPAINYQLQVAKDLNKDQSYFLYRLTQNQLSRIIFPLGDYLKSEVREIAHANEFKIKSEDESQDVCFIADNDFNKFISEKITDKPGEIVNSAGKVVGTHKGLHFYTIGQRKGINLGGDGPYFVTKKDLVNNQLVVSNVEGGEFLRDEFEIREPNWILTDLTFPLEAKAKIRYRTPAICAIIDETESNTLTNKEGDKIYKVKLTEKQKAITPGQSAVFYSEDGFVWGGGIII